jgi:hypothetical protein
VFTILYQYSKLYKLNNNNLFLYILIAFCYLFLGKCVVDETDEGWFITYIDRDLATTELEEKMRKKKKAEKDNKEREMEFLQQQILEGQKKKIS